MEDQIRTIVVITFITLINVSSAKVKTDTITNWQFYKDSELLFKSNFLDSSRYTAKIDCSDMYNNLVLSIFSDQGNRVIRRKVEFVLDKKTIATFSDKNYSLKNFEIPKNEIDKLFSEYGGKEIYIKYSDTFTKGVITIGILNLSDSKYSKLPIHEIKQIVQMAIDLPELNDYLSENVKDSSDPLIFKEFGLINQKNMDGIEKYGIQVRFLNEKEIRNQQIKKYLGVGDWSPVNDTLRLQLYYTFEGILINYIFTKVHSGWKITNALLVEQ
ncbi:MAG: hypothetical protein WBG46_04000 [Nonlabens sp.]